MNKLEQAARQLLEVAEGIQHGTDWNNGTHAKIYRLKFPEAITALREALEQLNCQCGDKCFPVFSGDIEYCETCGKPTALAEQVHTPYCKQAPMCKTPCGNSDCVEQAEHEPVAWLYDWEHEGEIVTGWVTQDFETTKFNNGHNVRPLYAAPVQQAEQEPVAYTNKEQLGYLKDPRYQATPLAMWASPFHENVNIALYAAPFNCKGKRCE